MDRLYKTQPQKDIPISVEHSKQAATKPRKKQSWQPNKEKSQHFTVLAFYLVRLAGFEPTTPWFVAKYSIQLSYSR